MLYKLFHYLPNAIKRLIERPFLISGAIVDPKGYGFFKLMLENANVPKKYQYMFLSEKKGEILVDCGAIDEGLYKDIKYIVVENHERFFRNGNEMLRKLKDKITKKRIDNIYLDWV